jgi:uncharacterized membrane protein YdjX (TVP38/TMEM64 family)
MMSIAIIMGSDNGKDYTLVGTIVASVLVTLAGIALLAALARKLWQGRRSWQDQRKRYVKHGE